MHLAKYVCMVLLALAMLAQAVPVSAPKGDAATIESAEMSAKIDSLSERVADLLKTTGAKNVVKGHPTPDKLSWKNLKPQEKLLILSMILGVVGNGSFIVSGAIGSHRLMQQQNRINQLNDELKTLKADGLAEPEPKPKPLITLRKRQGQDEVPLLSRTASARSKILNQLNNELSWLNSHPEGGKAAREQALNHIVGEINELRSSHKAFGDALKENEERLLHLAKELGVKIELTAQQTAEGMRPIDKVLVGGGIAAGGAALAAGVLAIGNTYEANHGDMASPLPTLENQAQKEGIRLRIDPNAISFSRND